MTCYGVTLPTKAGTCLYDSKRKNHTYANLCFDFALTFSLSPALLHAQAAVLANTPMTQRPMTVEDLFQFKRVGPPSISPDGRWVAYAVSEIVDSHQNKSQSRLWLVPTDGSGPPRQLTNGTAKDTNPKWSPDGRWILFESTRSGTSQLWVINPAGGESRQLTKISTDAATATWSPDGMHIAFVSAVYPEFSSLPFAESDAANKKKTDEIAESPVKARVFKRLFYRHWDSYVEDKRQHLFVIDLTSTESGDLEAGRSARRHSRGSGCLSDLHHFLCVAGFLFQSGQQSSDLQCGPCDR